MMAVAEQLSSGDRMIFVLQSNVIFSLEKRAILWRYFALFAVQK